MSGLVLAAVLRCIGDLGIVADEFSGSTALLDLPGFDSIVIVDVIERLEDELGVELEPELVMPETFRTPATLAAAFVQSGARDRIGEDTRCD